MRAFLHVAVICTSSLECTYGQTKKNTTPYCIQWAAYRLKDNVKPRNHFVKEQAAAVCDLSSCKPEKARDCVSTSDESTTLKKLEKSTALHIVST